MEMRLYVVFDKLAKETSSVWEARNDEVAKRKWNMEQRNNPWMEDSQFELLYVGTIDHDTGLIRSGEPKEVI